MVNFICVLYDGTPMLVSALLHQPFWLLFAFSILFCVVLMFQVHPLHVCKFDIRIESMADELTAKRERERENKIKIILMEVKNKKKKLKTNVSANESIKITTDENTKKKYSGV